MPFVILDPVQITDGTNNLGVTVGNAAKVDGSAVTQPVSAATLPLPTGAATSTIQTDGTQKAIVRGGAKGTTVAADVTSVSIDADRQALHVKVVGGSSSLVDNNVNIVDPSGNAIATADGGTPTSDRGLMISGYDDLNSLSRRVAVDSVGRVVVTQPSSTAPRAGFANGRVVLAATATAAVYATVYTEQTTNAQRSLVSASANDAAAGTGARTVRITYYDQALAGPFTETVTLNGTSAVNTVATNICYIERMDVLTVGSTGSNAGIISLKAATAGGGATVWSIEATANITYAAHHYVATGYTCYITGLMIGIKGADAASGVLKSRSVLTANAANNDISDLVRAPTGGQSLRTYGTAIRVPGPSKITGYVSPDSTSSRTYYLSFDYYDQ